MAIFYRGAGIGTYWHVHDARLSGFTPHFPGASPSLAQLMKHVATATTTSCYVSLSRSYGVAEWYALFAGTAPASPATPAYVYEVELFDPLPATLTLLDPVKEVAASLPTPTTAISYYHNGTKNFLLGVVDPVNPANRTHLAASAPAPPMTPPGHRPIVLTDELQAMVRSLRDAEVLAAGVIPASAIRSRLDVF